MSVIKLLLFNYVVGMVQLKGNSPFVSYYMSFYPINSHIALNYHKEITQHHKPSAQFSAQGCFYPITIEHVGALWLTSPSDVGQ